MEELYAIITDPEIDDCTRLEKHVKILDREEAFGSQTAATYAMESLSLFIEDKENGIDDDEAKNKQ